MAVCLIFEKFQRGVFHSCVFVLYINFTIEDICCWYIISNKWCSNNIVFYILDMEGLFKWFAHEFVLFHCSSGNREELDFPIVC